MNDHYRERGFVVLGFPCDQFGNQNPEDGDDSLLHVVHPLTQCGKSFSIRICL